MQFLNIVHSTGNIVTESNSTEYCSDPCRLTPRLMEDTRTVHQGVTGIAKKVRDDE
jgi:hypothetical protein